MTLKEIESYLNEGDDIAFTTDGEIYFYVGSDDVNVKTYRHRANALKYYLVALIRDCDRINNSYIHRVIPDKNLIETFQITLSESELEELDNMCKNY